MNTNNRVDLSPLVLLAPGIILPEVQKGRDIGNILLEDVAPLIEKMYKEADERDRIWEEERSEHIGFQEEVEKYWEGVFVTLRIPMSTESWDDPFSNAFDYFSSSDLNIDFVPGKTKKEYWRQYETEKQEALKKLLVLKWENRR